MLTYLQRLKDERDSLSRTSSDILESAAKEERSVSDTEKQSIAKMSERCAEIDTELKTFSEQYESQRAYAKLREKLTEADAPKREVEKRSPGKPTYQRAATWGEIFVTSDAFKNYDGSGRTAKVAVPNMLNRGGVTPPPSPEHLLESQSDWGFNYFPYVFNQPQPVTTTPLLDALGRVTTNNQVVQWITPGPAPLAEVVAEGDEKPEAEITIDTATGTLQTYAHWHALTRQSLANLPMIQSIVTDLLRQGIFDKLEADTATALAGASLGANIGVPPATAGGMLAAIRRAIATVQTQGFPNARDVLLNPMDWAGLDLSVMQYTNNGPNQGNAFWGLRPIASAKVPVGTAYVGQLSTAVTLFTMQQASVFMTDSHSDWFVRNILAVLAEVMALIMVTQPKAIVRISGTSATDAPAPSSSSSSTSSS